jgi:predicted N-acetyltransferase YhbS
MSETNVNLRPPTETDVEIVAKLIFDAFASIADKHNFPRDFPGMESAMGLASGWIAHPSVWGVLAERDGKIVGCNFLDERNPISGVGPICVDPSTQGSGIGRRLMQAVIERAKTKRAPGVRLVQDAFNTVSMSLYASCGFNVTEPLALMSGLPRSARASNDVRPVSQETIEPCAALCARVHGFDRAAELLDATKMFRPMALVRGGTVRAYATAPHFWILNHGVAETEDDLRDLLLGAAAHGGGQPIALLAPIRRAAFFRWCLGEGLRVIKPMSLMAMGDYREPTAAWFPSVEY